MREIYRLCGSARSFAALVRKDDLAHYQDGTLTVGEKPVADHRSAAKPKLRVDFD
ncbi:hypothetical protein [Roseibium marinum]|uniref:hypothetical protein n=1 Tax=Roseibium marinum TaxID=281252 RepID=UPI001473B4B3|nr:hypothetical protein [Roseibium marinum]